VFYLGAFALTSSCAWGPDRQTRVTLFAVNLSLQTGETASAVTADAEDANHQHYSLTVEYVAPLPNQEWLTVVVIKLRDELRAAATFWCEFLMAAPGAIAFVWGLARLVADPPTIPAPPHAGAALLNRRATT